MVELVSESIASEFGDCANGVVEDADATAARLARGGVGSGLPDRFLLEPVAGSGVGGDLGRSQCECDEAVGGGERVGRAAGLSGRSWEGQWGDGNGGECCGDVALARLGKRSAVGTRSNTDKFSS